MGVFAASISGSLAIVFALLAVERAITKDRRQVYERLKGITVLNSRNIGAKEGNEQGHGIDIKKILHNTGKMFAGESVTKRLESELIKADIPLRGEEYLMLRIIAAIVPGTLVMLLTNQLIFSLLVYILAAIAPQIFVGISQQKKLRKFNYQLIDSLAIMSNSLRAGYSFMQAVELVSREMPKPIGKEFARTFREINLGTTTEEALHNLGRRMGSDDLELIITAVLIQRQIGGNLAEILDNISHTIRERVRIQGEIKTLTAQGRISGFVIGLIPPALIVLLFIVNPGYMKPLFSNPVGLAMLGAGAVSELIGILIIRKIISIEI